MNVGLDELGKYIGSGELGNQPSILSYWTVEHIYTHLFLCCRKEIRMCKNCLEYKEFYQTTSCAKLIADKVTTQLLNLVQWRGMEKILGAD